MTHGPLFLSMNSGSAAKRSNSAADVKYMDIKKKYNAMCTKHNSEKTKQVIFTKFTSTMQWDDLSEIHDLFAVPLKPLRGPQGDRGPQFENHCYNTLHISLSKIAPHWNHLIANKQPQGSH